VKQFFSLEGALARRGPKDEGRANSRRGSVDRSSGVTAPFLYRRTRINSANQRISSDFGEHSRRRTKGQPVGMTMRFCGGAVRGSGG